jgi:hypothetical protein
MDGPSLFAGLKVFPHNNMGDSISYRGVLLVIVVTNEINRKNFDSKCSYVLRNQNFSYNFPCLCGFLNFLFIVYFGIEE